MIDVNARRAGDEALPDRNLALELVRVTEAAALQAARWIGRGDKEAADQAAVDGMHAVLRTIHMDGVVVIGEGEKDEAPMLHNGEEVGDGSPPRVDIAVDPLEGTRLFSWIHRRPRVRMVVYNQGAVTDGPFRLSRYPRSQAALRRALGHRRFGVR